MKITLRKYYQSNLYIRVKPSNRDVDFGFFCEEKNDTILLPYKLFQGQEFSIKYNCCSCDKEILIENILSHGKHEYNYFDIGYLFTIKYKFEFIKSISDVFKNLSLAVYEHFSEYHMKDLFSAKCLYQKCPHCEAQYLATYHDTHGQPPERTDPATPDEFYIEEMAWVEFDEEEFFKKMKEH